MKDMLNWLSLLIANVHLWTDYIIYCQNVLLK